MRTPVMCRFILHLTFTEQSKIVTPVNVLRLSDNENTTLSVFPTLFCKSYHPEEEGSTVHTRISKDSYVTYSTKSRYLR
jgi:hypothetical protein